MNELTGILTFINTLNYGAELQAYALCKTVACMGYNCELINYECAAVRDREKPRFPKLSEISNPKRFVGRGLKLPELYFRWKKFQQFSSRYVPRGEVVLDSSDILRKYDSIIVGSDQVWNPSVTGGDVTFLVPGHHRKSQRIISYAASFGDGDLPVSSREVYSKTLSSFDLISVRERRSLSILNALDIECPAVVSVDPTILLTRLEWEALASPVDSDDKYVFAYFVSERKETEKLARLFAEKLGIGIRYIDAYNSRPLLGAINMGDSSPADFVALIKNAEIIVTSSFHGMCLSIILNKQFRYVDSPGRDASRLRSLAEELGIAQYNVTNNEISDSINYTLVDREVNRLRANSLAYLAGALS